MPIPIAGTELVYKGGSVFHNHIIDIHAKYTGAKDGNTRIDWPVVYSVAVPDLVAALNAYGHHVTPSDICAYPHPPSAFCQENAELYYDFQLKNQYGPLSARLYAVLSASGVDQLAVVNTLFVVFGTEDIGDVLAHLALASRIAGQSGCDLYFRSTYMMLEEHIDNMAHLTGNSSGFIRSMLSLVFPDLSMRQVISRKLYGFGLCYGPQGLKPRLKMYFQLSDLSAEELVRLETIAQDSFERVSSETGIPKTNAFMLGLDFHRNELLAPSKFYFRGE